MHFINSHTSNIRLNFILKALCVGLITGVVVSSFRWLAELAGNFSLSIYKQVGQNHWLLLVLIALAFIVTYIVSLLMRGDPNIKGAGIPQVEAQLSGFMEMDWHSVIWRKYFASVLTMSTSIFVGREGPSVQLGAAVGQGLAETRHYSASQRRILIANGAAAGLAAAFNAPLAGTFFVMEEIYHNFSPLVWITSLTSALSANFISLYVFGLGPVLPINYQNIFPLSHYWQLLLLGIILGLASRLYQIGLLKVPGMFDRIKKIPWYYKSLIPMLLVIPIGVFLPITLGSGSHVVLNISHVMPSLTVLLILLVVRFVFAMISYGAGVAGGFFMPILAVGALIGAIVGNLLYSANLLDLGFVNNLIIFSMAAYFAGISKAPFTAIMLITELVGSMRNFMPLAFVVLIAYLVVDLTNGAPIYESLAERLATFKQLPIFKGRNEQVQIPVYAQSLAEDQQVRRVEWPQNSILTTIRRGSHEIVPSGDTLIVAGDLLIFTIPSDASGEIRPKLIALTQFLTENS